MKIVIDIKSLENLTGIYGYFKPLLEKILNHYDKDEIILIGSKFDSLIKENTNIKKFKQIHIKFPFFIFNDFIKSFLYGFFIFPWHLTKINPDLIISPYYYIRIPPNQRHKSLVTIHDMCYFSHKNIYKFYHYYMAQYFLHSNLADCKGIVTVSSTTKDEILKYCNSHNIKINKNKIIIIYNSFKFNNLSLKNTIQFQNISKKILYTGGFENRKNLDLMFQSLYKFNQINKKLCLVITGNLKYNYKFLRLLKKYNLYNSVILTGYLTDQEIHDLYYKIDFAVNLSLCEGFGRNNYEAKMYGIPLLCADIPVNHEIVGDYPIYCNVTNINDIIQGLKKLILTSKKIPLNTIDSRFTINTNVNKYISYINEAFK